MEGFSINIWAIIVAALAYMILGAVWYSPVLFGKSWMRLIGKSKEQIEKDFTPVNYAIAFVTAFLASYGIARIMVWKGGQTIQEAVMISVIAGICFVLTTIGVNDSFEKRPIGLTFINILYHLTGFFIIGLIIGAWR